MPKKLSERLTECKAKAPRCSLVTRDWCDLVVELAEHVGALEDKVIGQSAFRLLQGLVEAVEPGPHTCGKCSLFRELHGCPSAPRYSGRWYFVWPDEPACERFVAQVEPEDTDATIRKLREERDELEGEATKLFLAEANREIERLQKNCDYLYQKRAEAVDARVDVIQELAEAKAEIEGFRVSRRYWKKQCQDARNQRGEAEAVVRSLATEAGAEIDELRGQCKSEELCKGYPGLCTEAEAVVKSIKADAKIGELVRGMGKWTRLVRNSMGDYFTQTVVEPISGIWKTQSPRCGPAAEALRAIQKVEDV